MENTKRVIKQSDDDEWKAELQQFYKKCYNHYAERKAEEEHGASNTTPFIREFYKFFHSYEQALTEYHGKRQAAGGLRRKLINKRKSIKDEQKVITDTIEELVTKKGGTEGYKFLMENGLSELTAEYLVLQNKELFSKKAIEASEDKLSNV